MRIQAVRGTRDILPPESSKWLWMEGKLRDVLARFGYSEIRTPIFEYTELFNKGTGETTEIVQKQMYTFVDRGGRSVTLRPEGTPSVARALIEHGLLRRSKVMKLYYFGPMFRHDRPQAGRYRQFDQLGAELIGAPGPEGDVESVHLHVSLLRALGLKQFTVKVNSVGCPQCRPAYSNLIRETLGPRAAELCEDCVERLQKNPLRILDCKVESCRRIAATVPPITASLCPDCSRHYERLKVLLGSVGIEFEEDPGMVRGLDYYTRAAFEIHHGRLGAQSALGGGGRYDNLIAVYGGEPTPAVGFAAGLDRILLAVDEEGIRVPAGADVDAYVVAVGEATRDKCFSIAAWLREDHRVELDLGRRSLQSQMKAAASVGAKFAVIVGEDEMASGVLTVKDMTSGRQEKVPEVDVSGYLKRVLGK
ncbi:MAG: histidine--tRNA ligase [Candidatus Eisenbacteria bacterium]|nr:histidine--tRNA ligase [Candidatus Eisenbacteria bacterium]